MDYEFRGLNVAFVLYFTGKVGLKQTCCVPITPLLCAVPLPSLLAPHLTATYTEVQDCRLPGPPPSWHSVFRRGRLQGGTLSCLPRALPSRSTPPDSQTLPHRRQSQRQGGGANSISFQLQELSRMIPSFFQSLSSSKGARRGK